MLNSIWWLILMTLLHFLPAFFADAAPVLAGQVRALNRMAKPIDGGGKFLGERILGDNKTWRGLLAGVVGGIVGAFLKALLTGTLNPGSTVYWVFFGGVMGAGAIFGDALKSFLKRRLRIAPGKPWFFFDQVDYIVGAWVFSLPFVPFELSLRYLLCALVITPPLPIVANLIAYKMGWKKVWW